MVFIITLSLLGIVSFVIGVSFVLKATVSAPDMEKVVSKKEYEQAQQELRRILDEEQGLKQQLDLMAVELEDSRQKIASGEEVSRQVDALRSRDQEYQTAITQLKRQLEFLSRKADDQARQAIAAIQTLDSQRKSLKEELDHLDQTMPPEHIEALQKERAVLQQQIQANQEKISHLEKELSDVKERSGAELAQMVAEAERLRSENSAFQEGIQRMTEKIARVKTEVEDIRDQKERELLEARAMIERLQQEKGQESAASQLQGAADLERLEHEVQLLRDDSERRLKDAHGYIQSLKDQIGVLNNEIAVNRTRREELERDLEISRRGLDRSMVEHAAENANGLQESNSDLQRQLNELKLLNQFLKEKEGLLSEELLKSQTQAMGLQKICEEFQRELGSH
ncbi:MAG TPA: hypothetical protein P5160_07820 [Candidatus Omnitrophota bacterium]|nr:hypothetical protein [Candidatus Omnitrophota bacterium]